MNHVDWDYFDNFNTTIDKYMLTQGEGETVASQIVTAVNKLIYKWYNDGDVYDNNYGLTGWWNDLSSYANWLHANVPGASDMLERIYDISTEDEYEELLVDLADEYLDEELLEKWSQTDKIGTIYKCDGPFRFTENIEEDDEEGWW